jgi:transcriptional regulator with XRE-family HTH domain
MAIDIYPYRTELARRLGQLRMQADLSQRDFQETLGLGQNVLFRAEKELSMSIEALLTLVLFYVQEHDINPDWLFNPDNADIPMQHTQAKRDRKKVKVLDGLVEEMRVEELV